MKIWYVANVRLPSERANAYQIFAQGDALVDCGAQVSLIAPKRRNPFLLPDSGIVAHYGLRHEPRIERLFTLDWIDRVPVKWQRAPFWVQSLTFARSVRRRLGGEGEGVIYSRDPWSLPGLVAPGRAVFFEAHDLPSAVWARKRLAATLRRVSGVVTITAGLKEDLVDLGLARDRITVLPDGFDPARFRDLPGRAEARAELGLPLDVSLAVYAGHLFPWKGVDQLVEAAARSERFEAVLVGGREADRRRVQARIDALQTGRVRLVEPVSPMRVPAYLAAADVLVLPNSARMRISARYTSPLKLFEYMATGRPIVASDLPSLREVLRDGENATLVAPDDPEALRVGIEGCLEDPEGAKRRADRAWGEVERYSFDQRARRLIEWVKRREGAGA